MFPIHSPVSGTLTAQSDFAPGIATQADFRPAYPINSVRSYSGSLGGGGAVVPLDGFTTMVLGRP